MIESIVLEPTEGEFDVDAIERRFDMLSTAARDPQERRRFFLSPDPETLRAAVDERAAGARSISSEVVVVFPSSTRILIGVRTTDVAPAREFVEWLRGDLPLKIMDNEFNDLTAKCQTDLDYLFGTP